MRRCSAIASWSCCRLDALALSWRCDRSSGACGDWNAIAPWLKFKLGVNSDRSNADECDRPELAENSSFSPRVRVELILIEFIDGLSLCGDWGNPHLFFLFKKACKVEVRIIVWWQKANGLDLGLYFTSFFQVDSWRSPDFLMEKSFGVSADWKARQQACFGWL